MAFKTSTGLRDQMLDTGSMKSILDGGFIKIYSGPEPSTADDAIGSTGTNVLLCIVSIESGGAGLNFEADAVNGTLAKATGIVWSGVNLASGTASFYRHVGAADTAAASTVEPRVQGTIGLAGAELNLSSVTLSSGATQTIDHYIVALPTL